MTTTIPEIDELVLTGLDFEPTLPCEHSQHERLHIVSECASWVAYVFPCVHGSRYLICESGRRLFLELGVRCRECGVIYPPGKGVSFYPLAQNTT